MTLISEETPTSARDLESEQVPKLVKIPGILVAASGINAKTTRMEDCDGASFTDNLYEPQGDGHKLVTMVYAENSVTCVQHAEDASPYAYIDEADQPAAALHRTADRGHGHLAQARPPELAIPGRIDAINAGKTRDTTNMSNLRRRRLNQAIQRAEANGII